MQNQRTFGLLLGLCLLWAESAFAFRLIPYRLTMGRPGGGFESFSAYVSIPEAMVGLAPIQDDLARVLENHRLSASDGPLHRALAEPTFEWYLGRVSEEQYLYHEDAAAIADAIRRTAIPIEPENSSFILLTELGEPQKPVAFLRISYADKSGMLGVDRKRKSPVKKQKPRSQRIAFPTFRVNQAGVLDLFSPSHSEFLTFDVGARVELKHFSFVPNGLRKFFPPLFQMGRVHRLFAVAPGTDGESLLGVDEVVLDCLKTEARDFYLSLSFKEEERQRVKLANKKWVDYFILSGAVESLDQKILAFSQTLRQRRKIFLSLDDKAFKTCRKKIAEGATQ